MTKLKKAHRTQYHRTFTPLVSVSMQCVLARFGPPLIDHALLSRPEMEEQIVARHPVGRMGQPEEIAEAVVWLCSDAASFVTGHTMTVDGGYVAQ